MADKKISALTAATTPLAGTEVLPIVQSGSTVKVANNDLRPKQIQSNATSGVLQVVGPAASATRIMTVPDANFTVARTDAANSFTGNQTLSDGNIVQGTAAKGVNFTANSAQAGMTSQLLNWYETGTWTPVVTDGTTDVSMASNAGWYTRIGNLVTIYWNAYALDVSAINATNQLRLKTLPFTAGDKNSWGAAAFPYDNAGKNYGWRVPANATQLYFFVSGASTVDWVDCSRTTLGGTSVSFFGTATYRCA